MQLLEESFSKHVVKGRLKDGQWEKNTGEDDAEITHIPVGLICHNENHAPVC